MVNAIVKIHAASSLGATDDRLVQCCTLRVGVEASANTVLVVIRAGIEAVDEFTTRRDAWVLRR